MKRVVLMGGRPWVARDKGQSFTRALFRYNPKSIKLAFCIFAQPESEWQETEKWNKRMFDSFAAGRSISYKTMTNDNLVEVSRWADIIYIPGGDPFLLKEKLEPHNGELATIWDGKTIAGSSAGADLLCSSYLYLQKRAFGEGLGWVKASCIPHWRDDHNDYSSKDWDWAEKASLERNPQLPVICIPEGHFVEVTVK